MLDCDGQSSNRGDPIVVHRGSRWTEPDRGVFRRRRYRLVPPSQMAEAPYDAAIETLKGAPFSRRGELPRM
jgi:hypothetical protein